MRLGKLDIKRLERQDIEMMKHVLKFVIYLFIVFGVLLFAYGKI